MYNSFVSELVLFIRMTSVIHLMELIDQYLGWILRLSYGGCPVNL